MADKDIIDRPVDWPQRPVLSMKKTTVGSVDPKRGFILEHNPHKVFMKNTTEAEGTYFLKDVEFEEFATVNDMLAAGWVVD